MPTRDLRVNGGVRCGIVHCKSGARDARDARQRLADCFSGGCLAAINGMDDTIGPRNSANVGGERKGENVGRARADPTKFALVRAIEQHVSLGGGCDNENDRGGRESGDVAYQWLGFARKKRVNPINVIDERVQLA